MFVIMYFIYKVRMKVLKRVQRNIGFFEMNIWELVEEEKLVEVLGFDRFFLGISLSRSIFTELGNFLVYSDVDIVDIFFEVLLVEEKSRIRLY